MIETQLKVIVFLIFLAMLFLFVSSGIDASLEKNVDVRKSILQR